MLKKITPLLIATFFIFSCNQKNEKPTTALDTGRAFIRATLDGDFNTAESLIYKDTTNIQSFELYKILFSRKPDDVKQKYKNTDYVIKQDSVINDSAEIFNYYNNYLKEPTEIKVIRKNGEWKIDFKYSTGITSTN